MEEKLLSEISKLIDEIVKNSSSPSIVRELNDTLSVLMGSGRQS